MFDHMNTVNRPVSGTQAFDDVQDRTEAMIEARIAAAEALDNWNQLRAEYQLTLADRRADALAKAALMIRLTVVLAARAAVTDGRHRARREIAARSSIGGGDGR